MATTYRMEHAYDGVRLSVIDFGRKPWKQEHRPTEATIDRFTCIANRAALGNRREHMVSLLNSGEGFGWELTVWKVRPCACCGKPICEWDRDRFASERKCLDCEVKGKVAAEFAKRHSERNNDVRETQEEKEVAAGSDAHDCHSQ